MKAANAVKAAEHIVVAGLPQAEPKHQPIAQEGEGGNRDSTVKGDVASIPGVQRK